MCRPDPDDPPVIVASERGDRKGIRIFCPRRFCASGVTAITAEGLQKAGFEAVLLDLDNTLVGWQKSDISAAVREWLKELSAHGIKLCLVSNTRFGRRLRSLSQELGIPYVRQAWKPRRRGFREAMKELGVDPSKTVMIGDQMFTDIFGGNRCGVYTIMVKPVARSEFIGTKISRLAERILLAWFRKRGMLEGMGDDR